MTSNLTGSYTSFMFSTTWFPELLGEEFDGDILFRAECSKIIHSLCIVWLGVLCICSYLIHQEVFLTMTGQGSDV